MSKHGIVAVMRGGLPPLDYDTVAEASFAAEVGSKMAPIASLRSIVGFKRLAGRVNDRRELEELEELHGELPIDPIPGSTSSRRDHVGAGAYPTVDLCRI